MKDVQMMITRPLTCIAAVSLCAGLAACASTGHDMKPQELSQKTVHYECGAHGQQALDVQYTFQGSDPVAAKLIYNSQAIDLTRDTGSKTDMVGDTFTGNGYTWATEKFTRDDTSRARGSMLTQDTQQPAANGQGAALTHNILAKDCKVAG
jgi:hypothetical protein